MTFSEKQKVNWLNSVKEALNDLNKEVHNNVDKTINSLKKSMNKFNKEVHKKSVEKKSSNEYLIAKQKLQSFMSLSAADSNDIDDREMRRYHFDTVNWWRNVRPHPKMVVKEIKTLRKDIKKEIDSYLMSNPADVKWLQRYLNDCIYHWDNRPWMPRRMIDKEKLDSILRGTGMELEHHPGEKPEWQIREDWMLWPQTYAVLCCFEKEYRIS